MNLPSLINILFYLMFVIVLFPWTVIVLRLNILPDIITKFEEIMLFLQKMKNPKKRMSYFIKIK